MLTKNFVYNLIVVVLVLVIGVFSTNIEYEYPDFLQDMVDEPIYKLVSLGLIVYVSTIDCRIALLLAVVFIFSLSDINLLSEMSEGFLHGPPVASCKAYDGKKIKETGTAFYPLNDNTTIQNMRNDGKEEVERTDQMYF